MGGEPRFVRVHSRTNLPPLRRADKFVKKFSALPLVAAIILLTKALLALLNLYAVAFYLGLMFFPAPAGRCTLLLLVSSESLPTRNIVYPKGCGGDRKAPTKERAPVFPIKLKP